MNKETYNSRKSKDIEEMRNSDFAVYELCDESKERVGLAWFVLGNQDNRKYIHVRFFEDESYFLLLYPSLPKPDPKQRRLI